MARGPVKNGYARTTISVPAEIMKLFRAHLKKNPGLTMSALLTTAGELYVKLKLAAGVSAAKEILPPREVP